MKDVVISGSGVFTPPSTVSNEELVAAYNQYADKYNREYAQAIEAGEKQPLAYSSCEFIEKASGIKSRHVLYKEGILNPDVMHPIFDKRITGQLPEMVEMAVSAATEALAQAGRRADEVDLVICAASNFQRAYPALSVELQHALGAQGFAYDMNVACSSATFAIINASNAIKAGTANVVLIVNPEFASPQINYKSRDSHFIFGDVCAATVVESLEGCNTTHAFKLLGSTQKTQFSSNIRCEVSYIDHCIEKLDDANPYFIQQGRKVFKELLPIVFNTIESHFDQLQISADDFKRLWLHQANSHMNDFVSKKVLQQADVDPVQAPLVLDQYANTASAGSIVAFHQYKQDFVAGDKGLLCSFGAGYSVGCISLQKL